MRALDINELLKGVDCTCGKEHSCPIQAVYIEKDAIRHLTELSEDYDRVLLVADENTYGAAGLQTEQALTGKDLRKKIFSGKEILVPNESAIEAVEAVLGDAELIVGVGSGVIQDLCKYVSHDRKVPYMIVATAPSMDGYASSGAAMITGGMKVTYSVGLPTAILADTEVLRQAPMDMIKAGYGDILGKYSSLNDWKLSSCVKGEYFCQYIYDMTMEQVEQTLRLAEGLLNREEKSIRTLTEALVVVGILISFVGSSRPASGSEHHLSHYFEITGLVTDTPYFPHGLDVAYSSVVTAELRQELLEQGLPEKNCVPGRAAYEATMERLYRQVGKECVALQDQVGHYTSERGAAYRAKADEIRAVLSEAPAPEEMRRMLAKAQIDMAPFYALYGEEKIQDGVWYAKDLKDRYTVLWMYYDRFGRN